MAQTARVGIGDPFLAFDRAEQLFNNVTTALNEAGVPFAVVGGYAVAAWVAGVDEGAVRATKDVDLLARHKDLPALSKALRQVGLDEAEVLGVTKFVDRERPNPKTGVHIVLAN